MSSMAISWIVFGVVFGGAVLGMILRAWLPERYVREDSKDVVKLAMGLIGTMTALVLGLLIASAKGSFDTQRNGLAQMSGNVIFLDRTLRHYGPESKDARDVLRASVADMLERTWPDESSQPAQAKTRAGTEGDYEVVYTKIEELAPKNDTQRSLQAQAMKTATDIGQVRWVLVAQKKGRSTPTAFLVVMVFWLALILASFGLFAPRNAMAVVILLLCALAISTAIFLILELDQPYDGIIRISSAPLRGALAQLDR